MTLGLNVIFTILIQLKIPGIIHIDIQYIMLLLLLSLLQPSASAHLLNSLLHFGLIERVEGDVYAAHPKLVLRSDWQYNIYQSQDQISQEFSITFFPVKLMIHLSCKVKNCSEILWIIARIVPSFESFYLKIVLTKPYHCSTSESGNKFKWFRIHNFLPISVYREF